MKFKYRLTITNSLLTLSLIAVIVSVLFFQGAAMQDRVILQDMTSQSALYAAKVSEFYKTYLEKAKTVSVIMSGYELVYPELRRTEFTDILRNILESDENVMGIYAFWRDGVIDEEEQAFVPYYSRLKGAVAEDAYSGHQQVLAETTQDDFISFPAAMTVQGKNALIIEVRSAVTVRGTVVAVVGMQINIAPLQPYVANLRPYETGHVAVVAADGIICAHYRDDMVGKPFTQGVSSSFPSAGADIVPRLAARNEPTTFSTKDLMWVSYPFTVGTAKNRYLIFAMADLKTVRGPLVKLVQFAIIFVAAAALVGSGCIYLISNSLSRRVNRVADRMKDISEGEGDLTIRLKIYSNDEIGSMGTHFNKILDSIQQLIRQVKVQAAGLEEIGGKLTANMNETAQSVNEIAASIGDVKQQTQTQAENVNKAAKTIGDIDSVIENLGTHIAMQAQDIAKSSAAIEEMVSSIASVAKTLVCNAKNMEALSSAAESGRTGLSGVAAEMQNVAKESEGLIGITSVMANIASQTNLLSMNAAIEAAHAGESGKGFAVVAEEIRKLAESSSKQSKTIATVLKQIKESIDKISQSTVAVLERFEAIDQGVQTVSAQEGAVRDAMAEQDIGSKQILEVITRLTERTQTIKESFSRMRQGGREIGAECRNLEQVTAEISEHMNEMSKEAEKINGAVLQVNAISSETKQSIDLLQSELSKFKAE
ncbi:MAG: methyl-accepting chemotaxis protein [Spirochaetaceae bacterium]|jgi:methyl-accepting chemotaxis protein|nr:methyl-accepting chemotaxis protein [Spirochaetaceae bacterium]